MTAKRELPACVRCHGTAMTGVEPATPGLLGLPRDYLVGQLGAWQNGRRHTPTPDCMARVAQKLSAEDVGAIASWLSAQPLPGQIAVRAVVTRQAAAGLRQRGAIGRTSMITRTLRQFLLVLLLLGVVAAAVALWWNERDESSTTSAPEALAPTPQQIERGAYLARAGNCAGCHTARGAKPYAGGVGIATPFGTVFSSNLTPDNANGLGQWSSGDFWRALHHGRSRDGRLLYPAFPYTSYTLVKP